MERNRRPIDAGERIDLIRCLKKYHDANFTPGIYEHSAFGRAALMLEQTADAKPVRHGRWVWHTNGEINCSECDGLIGVAYADTAYKEAIRDHHFCLYCGAKMDLEVGYGTG